MKRLADGSPLGRGARHASERLAQGFVAAAALMLPNCFFDASVLPLTPEYEYTATATFLDGAGTPHNITDADADFAGGMARLKRFVGTRCESHDDCDIPPADVLTDWKRYLSRRFTEVASDPGGEAAFRIRFGEPPYCLLEGTATVTLTDRLITSWPGRREDPIWPEAEPCDSATATDTGCGNQPGVAPRIELMPLFLDFGSAPPGTSGGRRYLNISNAGPGRLCLDGPRLDAPSENPDSFPLDVSVCRPWSDEETRLGKIILNADQSCRMFVNFRPTEPGPLWADVLLSSNDPLLPHARLRASGVGEAGNLAVNPNPLCFNVAPEVIGGRMCRRGTLEFTNTGPGAVTVQPLSVPLAAGWSVESPPGEFTVPAPEPPATSSTVPVTLLACDPLLMESVILVINSNAAVAPPDVTLLGPGTGCVPLP